jgi:hypothetical protein
MKHCFLLLFSVLFFMPARAYSVDQLQVSLLTVEPRADHVYTVYGHTALRLYDPAQQIDEVFNWGMFDFDAPNFLYRFVRGETDYSLGHSSFPHFLYAYQVGNATVIEQILNLSPEGKERLLQQISLNLQPENLIYRYNFLFDNCTTRVRDLIEQSAPELTYPAPPAPTTFRHLIHSCTASHAWMTFGIDLIIGSGADSLISIRQELFLPQKLSEALVPPLVLSSQEVLTSVPEAVGRRPWWDSPVVFGYILLTGYAIAVALGWRKRRPLRMGFAPLFLVAGAAGCLLAFMATFSLHPCVSGNWNLGWLHPLQLLAFVGYWRKWKGLFIRILYIYHSINCAALGGLLLGWQWLPQRLHPADIPLILCLLLASVYWIIYNEKEKRRLNG